MLIDPGRPFAEAAVALRIPLCPHPVNRQVGAVQRTEREFRQTVVGKVNSVEIRDIGSNEFVGNRSQMVVRKVQRLYVHHLVSDKAALLESLQRAAPEGEVADNGA